MGLFTINSKMRKSVNNQYKKIVNFTIPALVTKDGFKTCPNAGACAKGCYARMGAYVWPKVYAKHLSNLEATKHKAFTQLAITELIKIKANLVRIHDSGDFYSKDYVNKWLEVCKALPNIQFYAYTKMISLFKSIDKLPNNLIIIYSYGGIEDNLIDPLHDRHSMVFETETELKAWGYIDTSNDDTLALGINPKIGLVYHGNKSFTNTNWGNVK